MQCAGKLMHARMQHFECVIHEGLAQTRGAARKALADFEVEFGRVLHPSPASPLANKGWEAQAERELLAMGVDLG